MAETERTVQAIRKMFNARSLALVGASNDPHKFGYMTLHSILKGGYKGKIYPVNSKGGEFQGLRAHRSLSEIPEEVDLIVVLVPAHFVPGILREAAAKGVAGAIVCSGGFRETGQVDLEEDLRLIAKQHGIRILGPNIAGINYLPNRLCAMFFPVITVRGPLAIVSQSGTVTNGLSEWAAGEGLGITAAVNLGNQVDLCESDFLDFFATDENTKAIAMYLEGVQDGRRFLTALKQATVRKPVVVLKAGRTPVGQRSASSHTGSLATSYDVFSAACRQCGAIVADNLESLYDCAKALATLRLPKGNRIFSISSSGGAGTLAADVADAQGLVFPKPTPEFMEGLKKLPLSALATLANPFDTGADLDVDHFKKVALLADRLDLADLIFLNFGDPMAGATEMVKDLDANIKSSLAIGYFAGGEEEMQGRVNLHEAGFGVFPAPERAMAGIAATIQYARFRQSRAGKDSHLFPGKTDVGPRKGEGRFITEPEAMEYLKEYRIPYPEYGVAQSAEEAVETSERLGYPVVLKVVSPDIIHKSGAGGVLIGLNNREEVIKGFKRIHADVEKHAPGASIEGIMICKQIHDGLEVIIGAVEDPLFGRTLMFGLGGIFAEVIRDVTFRIAPLTRSDAEEMVREIKGYRLLTGARGRYRIDPLLDLLVSVSRLVIERPEIKELDLNPVRLHEGGITALDVRIMRWETSVE
jgi:acetate---CoA ligase (ADP-forming)